MNNNNDDLSALLNTLPTPEHRQGFWDDLNTQLSTDTDSSAQSISVISDLDDPSTGRDVSDNGTDEHRRTWWGVVALAAAAIILAAVFGVRALTDNDDPPVVTEIVTPTTIPAPVDEEPEPDLTDIIDISDSVSIVDLGGHRPMGMAVGAGSVWKTTRDRELLRIDPATGAIDAVIDMPKTLTGALAVGDDAVWVRAQDSLHRVDPATNSIVAEIDGVGSTGDVALSDGAVWVSGTTTDTEVWFTTGNNVEVHRIDPANNTIIATIPVTPPKVRPFQPQGRLVIGPDGDVYVESADSIIFGIDPRTNTVVELNRTNYARRAFLVDDAAWTVGDFFVNRADAALENSVLVFSPDDDEFAGAGFLDGDPLIIGTKGHLYRLDEKSGALTNTFGLGIDLTASPPVEIARYEDFVWISDGGRLWRVDISALNTATTAPATIDEKPEPEIIDAVGASQWEYHTTDTPYFEWTLEPQEDQFGNTASVDDETIAVLDDVFYAVEPLGLSRSDDGISWQSLDESNTRYEGNIAPSWAPGTKPRSYEPLTITSNGQELTMLDIPQLATEPLPLHLWRSNDGETWSLAIIEPTNSPPVPIPIVDDYVWPRTAAAHVAASPDTVLVASVRTGKIDWWSFDPGTFDSEGFPSSFLSADAGPDGITITKHLTGESPRLFTWDELDPQARALYDWMQRPGRVELHAIDSAGNVTALEWPLGESSLGGLAWTGNEFIAWNASGPGSQQIVSSPDGQVWSEPISHDEGMFLTGMIGDVMIATTTDGISSSTDLGATFKPIDLDLTKFAAVHPPAVQGNSAVAMALSVGRPGRMLSSSDGQKWTKTKYPPVDHTDPTDDSSNFFFVGPDGTIYGYTALGVHVLEPTE